jgi:hypothetical protein
MATTRAKIPSPGAFVVALAGALCACRADPASTVAAPDARVETPDARVDTPDAAAAPLAWESLQFRAFPSGFYGWSETFFQGQGEPALELRPTGEFWVLLRAISTPGGTFDPGRLWTGTLDPATAEAVFGALDTAGPVLLAPSRYTCTLCGSECTFLGLNLVTAEGAHQTIGDQTFGPRCDAEFGNVPPSLTPLAVGLREIIEGARSGATGLAPADPPPRLRLGVVEPRQGFPTDPSAADLDAATPWPFASPSLAEIAQGDRERTWWWWEASLTGEPATTVWAYCAERMAAGTMEFGAGPFLAREGGAVYAVACAPALPGAPWVD